MELIDQLADVVGLHSSYFGTYGDKVFAKKQAKESLLKAMGFKLDDQSLIDTLEKINHKAWLNILPEVHIIGLEQNIFTIKLSLANDKVNSTIQSCSQIHWEIAANLENMPEASSANKYAGTSNVNEMLKGEIATINGVCYQKYNLPLPQLAQGYYQLTISYRDEKASCPLIYAPKTCYSAKEASSAKMWGYTAQIYSLRSKNNWGIGDFSDLKSLVEKSANQQSAAIGLNPLHPLYYQNPAHLSQYSP
jgi:4-alpha-glucanotransferase